MRVMVFFDGACIALEPLAAGEYLIGPEAGAGIDAGAAQAYQPTARD